MTGLMAEPQATAPGRGPSAYILLISIVAALGGLLFGYDTAVIAGAIGFLKTHFRLDPAMQGWVASSALLGCVIGVSFAGLFSDKFGRRRTLLLAGALFFLSAIGTSLPRDVAIFVIFRILGGVGIGIASMASPMYIAEISPAHIRGRMVSLNQFAIVSGILIVYFVNYFIAGLGDAAWQTAYAWRWMFASGLIPSGIFLALLQFVPESPRWLAENGQSDKALVTLAKIDGDEHAQKEMQAIEEAIEFEKQSINAVYAPGMRGLLLLGMALAALQQVTGINVFLYYGTEIFKKAGATVNAALAETVVVGIVNLAFTVIAVYTVDKLGRKPLLIFGSIGMGACLVAIGIAAQSGHVAAWLLLFLLGYIACFAMSVGPVTWVVLSEIFPTKIRGRAMSVATFSLWTANFIVSQTFPMMDSNLSLVHLFHHAFPFYIYAGFCAVMALIVWQCLPETKGRTLEEIEMHWAK